METAQKPESPLKDPASLFFEQPKTRRIILASYWAVVLLALPLWWVATSIERLSLPGSRVHSQEHKQLHFPLLLEFSVADSVLNAQRVANELQTSFVNQASDIDARLALSNTRITMRDGSNLDSSISYEVSIVPDVDQPTVQGRRLLVSPEAASAVPQTVASLLTPYSTHRTSQSFEHLVAKFAPRYRLAFTLLNEDAADGKTVAGWDIQGALSRHITPALNQLNALHKFTVESQVHFHAPLAFEPYHSSTEEEELYGVTQEDLTVFVNSAEWTLSSSVSNDPVLHFILFIPSKSHTPLRILDTDNRPAPWNAFVLPQWGGIVLLNLPEDAPSSTDLSATDLDAVFRTFRTQLLTLLGVSDLPTGVASADPKGQLTDWQLDTLYRKRAVENVASGKETLQSIVKLVDQIPNMPVGQDVKGDVQDALTALEKAYKATFISPTSALRHSSEALSLASRAFFNPGMLALLYFPAEHKYAVYTPLFAPVAVPLIVTVLREMSAWRKAQKGKRKPSGEQIEQDEQKSK